MSAGLLRDYVEIPTPRTDVISRSPDAPVRRRSYVRRMNTKLTVASAHQCALPTELLDVDSSWT